MIVLRATDLIKKSGFDDGLLLSDLLEDAGYDCSATRPVDDDMWADQAFDHAVLVEVVKLHLCPKLLGYEIDTCCSQSHNPVRIAQPEGCDGSLLRQSLEGIAVEISEQQVLDAAQRVWSEFAALADTGFVNA